MILAQIGPRGRRGTTTQEPGPQSPPLVGPNLIGDQEYVSRPWTCSKVEPDPQRTQEGARTERRQARAPLGNTAETALGNENDSRSGRRPPHYAMTHRREDGERHDPRRQGGERDSCNEQRMQ